MAHDSREKGFERGREDALAGREQRHAQGDAAKFERDPGYGEFWAGYDEGYADGEHERASQAGGLELEEIDEFA